MGAAKCNGSVTLTLQPSDYFIVSGSPVTLPIGGSETCE